MLGQIRNGILGASLLFGSVLATEVANAESQQSKNTPSAPDVRQGARFIKGIRGRLYREGSDLLDAGDVFAGSAETRNAFLSANALFVLVDIGGAPVNHKTNGVVEILARSGGVTVLATSVPLRSFFTQTGQTLTVPFLVYKTGCVPLEVTATLKVTGAAPSSKKVVAPFECGE